jgi:SAM-dependent methyltransferase
MTRAAVTPFDRHAHEYDAKFSNRLPARWLRDMTRRRIEPLIHAGDTVLEIGCGTGVDALWLAGRGCRVVATDASDAMLAIARGKPVLAEVAARMSWARLDAAQPGELADLLGTGHRANLVLSNFGALNCVRDLAPLFGALRPLLDPGAHVAVTLMGRFCLWESAYFGARGRWTQMRRRWSGASRYDDTECSIDVWYHSPADVLRMAPGFERVGLYGIGALIPPSEAFALCERWPRLFRVLARADDRLGRWLHFLSDHYLLVLGLQR